MTTTEFGQAEERAKRLSEVVHETLAEAHKAWAEVARLKLLELAEQMPYLEGMSFESNYEYDDEGGYFRTVSVYPSDFPEDIDPYEFSDAMGAFGPEAIAVLCGQHEDAWEGQITIAEARERKF